MRRISVLAGMIAWLLAPAWALPPGARVEIVHTGGVFLTGLAFAPDGRLFFIEKPGFNGPATGRCWIITNGALGSQPYLSLDVDTSGERGLLGIAIDPDFATNHYVFFYYTSPSPSVNRILRTVEKHGVATEPTVIYESPPLTAATNHNGGPLAFGPDGKLYCVIGENAMPARAQDLSTPIGKVLRLNRDGTAPDDNPFVAGDRFPNADKRVWSWGHRNSFGLTFHPNGLCYETENGPNCDDEINLVEAGKNYGWDPRYACYPGQPTENTSLTPPFPYTMPLPYAKPTVSQYVYATAATAPPFRTVAPTGIAAYTGWQMGEVRGDLIYGWNNAAALWRVALSGDGRTALAHQPFLLPGDIPSGEAPLGAVAAVVNGPDGALYFTDYSYGNGQGRIRRVTRAAPPLTSVARALSIAAGLTAAASADTALDVYPPAAPDGLIDLRDAVRNARILFRLDG